MTVSLDFIAAQLQRVLERQQESREEVRQIRSDLAGLRRELEQQHDETTVKSAVVMRYAGEHLAWGAVQNQLRRMGERFEALESKT
jgi:cell division protein FtsB